MASQDIAKVTSEPLKDEKAPHTSSKHAAQDIKPSDAEENDDPAAPPGEL